MVITVFETKSTITILALLTGLVLCVLLKKDIKLKDNISNNYVIKTGCNKKMFALLTTILMIILSFYYMDIALWIIDITSESNDIVFSRVGEIALKLAYGEAATGTGDLDARLSIIKTAIGSFWNSPIIGNGYQYGYIFDYSTLYGIGNHCEWLDALAAMGIVGGIPYLLIYIFAVLEERKYNNKRSSYAYIIVLFMLGLLNPFRTYQSHLVVFYVIISISYLLYIKELKHVIYEARDK